MSILLVVLYCVLTVAGLILYKVGANHEFVFMIKNNIFQIKMSLISLIGLCCYVCSFLIYILLIPRFNLSYILPVTAAITYISIFILSVLLLKEQVTLNSIIGTVFILIGILLMTFVKK